MTVSNLRADISVQNKPLKEVVLSVQQQTGYRVELTSIDESFLVSGEYNNVGVEKIFTRLLKGYNVAVAINQFNRSIFVISLGSKIQRAKNSNVPEVASSKMPEGQDSEKALSPVGEIEAESSDKSYSDLSLEPAGLSSKNIQILHTQQVDELRRRQGDPDYVDPLTGLTSAELGKMHKKQIMELDQAVK